MAFPLYHTQFPLNSNCHSLLHDKKIMETITVNYDQVGMLNANVVIIISEVKLAFLAVLGKIIGKFIEWYTEKTPKFYG